MRHPSYLPKGKLSAKRITPESVTGEADLREEYDKLVLGIGEKLRHGHPMVLRKARRDEKGFPVLCTCSEKDPNRQGSRECVYCLGEGFLWDESWTIGYVMSVNSENGKTNTFVRMPSGNIKGNFKVFFLRYDVAIKYGDKIIEVRLDEEGKVQLSSTKNSFIRKEIHKPQTISEMRSDNGRLEYYSVYCREEDSIRNTNPNE